MEYQASQADDIRWRVQTLASNGTLDSFSVCDHYANDGRCWVAWGFKGNGSSGHLDVTMDRAEATALRDMLTAWLTPKG